MGVVWRNGDLSKLSTAVGRIPGVAIDSAEQIVTQTVEEGAELQRQLLDAATTRTGNERMARGVGNTAGRNKSGQMIGSISSDVQVSSKRVEGEWGFPFTAEDYYRYQEDGTSRIPAAHALLDSFIALRSVFIRRVVRMVGK